MIYIVLATFTSVLMLVVLRLLEYQRAHTFYALIFNYLSAFVCGITNVFLFNKHANLSMSIGGWVLTMVEGVLFITVFYWMAQTTKHYGMSVTSVANKMSLIFPVVSAFILFDEPIGWIKWLGLLLALLSVYMVTYTDTKEGITGHRNKIIYPLLVFVGSGIVDSIINYGNKTYVTTNDNQLMFTSFVYLFALLTGLMYLKIIPPDKNTHKRFYHQESFSWKSTVFLGLLLGIPNFYNLFFIIQALNSKIFLSSQIFLILNVSNIIVSALTGVLLFKEHMGWINWIGIVFAILSIVLVV